MDRFRKAGTDRRSGVDRRSAVMQYFKGVDRRIDSERREKTDRRFVPRSTAAGKPRSNFWNLFSKNKSDAHRSAEVQAAKKAPARNIQVTDGLTPRSGQRIDCEIPVRIQDQDTYELHPATVRNYSRTGMGLELEYAPRIGTGLVIEIFKQSGKGKRPADISKYYSRVVWRKKVRGNVVFLCYGIGVRHCREIDEFLSLFGQ